MKSHTMKHCTIIYDAPSLTGIFAPHANGEAAFLVNMHLYDMRKAVENASERLGFGNETLLWSEAGLHPLRLGFVCPDALADRLRMELIEDYIVELDPV
jgi:hypothetical protein